MQTLRDEFDATDFPEWFCNYMHTLQYPDPKVLEQTKVPKPNFPKKFDKQQTGVPMERLVNTIFQYRFEMEDARAEESDSEGEPVVPIDGKFVGKTSHPFAMLPSNQLRAVFTRTTLNVDELTMGNEASYVARLRRDLCQIDALHSPVDEEGNILRIRALVVTSPPWGVYKDQPHDTALTGAEVLAFAKGFSQVLEGREHTILLHLPLSLFQKYTEAFTVRGYIAANSPIVFVGKSTERCRMLT